MSAERKAENILVMAPQDPQEKEPKEFLRDTYREALKRAGLNAIIVHPGMTEEELIDAYNQCSAVVAVGGWDWNSKLYSQEPSPENDKPVDDQDANEQMLLLKALEDKMPILGICRGEQGIGIAVAKKYGKIDKDTSLFIQHLPEVTSVNHGVKKYDELLENKHTVYIKEDTIAHEIFNASEIDVPSGHHQALNKKAIDEISVLVISGMSDDEIIEIIEMKKNEHPFCFGIQGHPEPVPELIDKIIQRLKLEAEKFAGRDAETPPVGGFSMTGNLHRIKRIELSS